MSPDLDPSDRAQLLASLTGETERLGRLVADLMELARGEELIKPVLTEVRLDELAEAAVALARARYPNVIFTLNAEPTSVVGDPARLAVRSTTCSTMPANGARREPRSRSRSRPASCPSG